MSDVQQEKTGLDPGLEEELKQRAAQQLAQSVTPGGTAAAEKTGTPPAAAPTPAAAKKQPQGVTLNEQSTTHRSQHWETCYCKFWVCSTQV